MIVHGKLKYGSGGCGDICQCILMRGKRSERRKYVRGSVWKGVCEREYARGIMWEGVCEKCAGATTDWPCCHLVRLCVDHFGKWLAAGLRCRITEYVKILILYSCGLVLAGLGSCCASLKMWHGVCERVCVRGSVWEGVCERGSMWEGVCEREGMWERGYVREGVCERGSIWEREYVRGSVWERECVREGVFKINKKESALPTADSPVCVWSNRPSIQEVTSLY